MTEQTAAVPAVTMTKGQSIARLDQYGVDSPARPYLENMAKMIDDMLVRKMLVTCRGDRPRICKAISKMSIAIDWYLVAMKTDFE